MHTSFDNLLKALPPTEHSGGAMRLQMLDSKLPATDKLKGRVERSRRHGGGGASPTKLTRQLSKRLKRRPTKAADSANGGERGGSFDRRQRAVVKTHYFNHAGKGAAGLKAHAQYVERDAARRDPQEIDEAPRRDDETPAKQHAQYLDRQGRGRFYDAGSDHVDGSGRVEGWAKSDRRHFRVILSAEEGAALPDLKAYTRQVMARAEAALGTKLSWVAVDHHDTDNPHTHLIIRGRRANGQDLVLPKDLIKHGLRNIARDVATEWLGERTPAQERLALEREVRRHAPTRLDRLLEGQARSDGTLRLANVEAPNKNPDLTQALKNRVRELQRMGLGSEVSRGVFALTPDWHDRLKAMELHLDIRKRVVRERVERLVARSAQQLTHQIKKGLLDR
ncbi:MAG: hypothetical protein NW206_08245 [Hyphomonadaceae bacterium]|nr:hypothetical protein [Hyphomonadaceae bacterium]